MEYPCNCSSNEGTDVGAKILLVLLLLGVFGFFLYLTVKSTSLPLGEPYHDEENACTSCCSPLSKYGCNVEYRTPEMEKSQLLPVKSCEDACLYNECISEYKDSRKCYSLVNGY